MFISTLEFLPEYSYEVSWVFWVFSRVLSRVFSKVLNKLSQHFPHSSSQTIDCSTSHKTSNSNSQVLHPKYTFESHPTKLQHQKFPSTPSSLSSSYPSPSASFLQFFIFTFFLSTSILLCRSHTQSPHRGQAKYKSRRENEKRLKFCFIINLIRRIRFSFSWKKFFCEKILEKKKTTCFDLSY
jgi:hypothetical protein